MSLISIQYCIEVCFPLICVPPTDHNIHPTVEIKVNGWHRRKHILVKGVDGPRMIFQLEIGLCHTWLLYPIISVSALATKKQLLVLTVRDCFYCLVHLKDINYTLPALLPLSPCQ